MDKDLEKFKDAENKAAAKHVNMDNDNIDDTAEDANVSMLDGYKQIDKAKMPFGGKLYPECWDFYYRCPTTKEVANFSTINEEDRTAIIKGVSDLIKKCYLIANTETKKLVSSEEINDGERLFFFLLLREFYLNDAPIQYSIVDENDEDGVIKINFVADSLVFEELKQGLYDSFDGRLFTFDYKELKEDEELEDDGKIKFLIPTLKTTTRIIKYMETLHKKVSDVNRDGITKEDFNKQFILFAPFLYETGTESVSFLRKKFANLQKNDLKYRKLNSIINQLKSKLTNLDTIRYVLNDNEGDCLMKFPGGWKGMFVDNTEFSEIF